MRPIPAPRNPDALPMPEGDTRWFLAMSGKRS